MRETKFRGKSDLTIEELEEAGVPHKNGWIVGNLIGNEKLPVIVGPILDCNDEYFNTEWWASVIPETVGQETSLTECENLKQEKITAFEGDIAKIGWSDQVGECHSTTIVIKNPFDYEINEATHLNYSEYVVIIGNIHDNPELLEVAK